METVPVFVLWQVTHVRPLPPKVSLSKRNFPFLAWPCRSSVVLSSAKALTAAASNPAKIRSVVLFFIQWSLNFSVDFCWRILAHTQSFHQNSPPAHPSEAFTPSLERIG